MVRMVRRGTGHNLTAYNCFVVIEIYFNFFSPRPTQVIAYISVQQDMFFLAECEPTFGVMATIEGAMQRAPVSVDAVHSVSTRCRSGQCCFYKLLP
jgi:hypothetical protein